jgi:hypothetical protein
LCCENNQQCGVGCFCLIDGPIHGDRQLKYSTGFSLYSHSDLSGNLQTSIRVFAIDQVLVSGKRQTQDKNKRADHGLNVSGVF